MPEVVTFTASIDPSRTVFRVSYLALDDFNQRIDIQFRDWDGSKYGERVFVPTPYTGSEAAMLIRGLNKANLSTQSLQHRIIARLLADGKIPPGTSGGTPD